MTGTITYDLAPHLAAGGAKGVTREPNRRPLQACESAEPYSAGAARKRFAVVTCLAGDDAPLRIPRFPLGDADYIFFSDRPRPDGGLFRIRPIDFFHIDPSLTMQFVKTHLHLYLAGYEAAIWLDAGLVVRGDLRPFLETFLSFGEPLGAIGRTFWRSVRQPEDGAPAAVEPLTAETDGGDRLRRAGSGFFICRPGHRRFKALCDLWWSGLDQGAGRNRAAIDRALRKTGLKLIPLTKDATRVAEVFALAPKGLEGSVPGQSASAAGAVRDPYEAVPYAALKGERLAAQRGRRVDIVVCVHDALDDAKRCLASLVPTLAPGHRVILIDDGSSPPTEKWLKTIAAGDRRMLLIRNPKSQGYTRAANIGLRASDAEFVILLNSDTIVTPDWIGKLGDAAFTNPAVGLVGPLSNAANLQSIPRHIGSRRQTAINATPPHVSIDSMSRQCEEWTAGSFLPRVPLVHGFCLGIRREVIERIGLLDEETFPRGYGEESDYCLRAGDAGFGLMVATHTYIHHAKSRSYADSERIALTKAAGAALRSTYGASRVNKAVLSVARNPILQVFRARARAYYSQG